MWSFGNQNFVNMDGSKARVKPPEKLKGVDKRRRSITLTTEMLKERQNQIRASKEAMKARLTDEHQHILSIVAFKTDLTMDTVLDFIVENEESIDLMNNFFLPGGRRSLLFYYQQCQEGSNTELRTRAIQHTQAEHPLRLFITDGTTKPLTGLLLYFIRPSNLKELKVRNIVEEVCFGTMDCSDGCGILHALAKIMSSIYSPAVQALKTWGDLDETPQGQVAKKEFLKSLGSFTHFIDATHMALSDSIELKACEAINVYEYNTTAQFLSVANNPELLQQLEELIQVWCKQIEQVLAESEQMRKEADDTGPIAELEHWRQRRAKFNSLLDQMKSKQCKTVIGILLHAKSKVLKTWKELDNRITDAANEAKDNVKYLDTLEKSCHPLYQSDPVKMITAIPKLIGAIQMIHSTSQYYNTSQRMTSLFIKVTNQMVTACKQYVTDGQLNRIWDQPRKPLIEKLNSCITLNREYQNCFQKTKQKIEEDPLEKPFEFSEMYIFGKFDTFCRRLQKIKELMTNLEIYNILHVSKIEGIDVLAARFDNIYKNMQKKNYDALDHRKTDFDYDFKEFKERIEELECQLQNFMDDCFEKLTSTIQSLQLLESCMKDYEKTPLCSVIYHQLPERLLGHVN